MLKKICLFFSLFTFFFTFNGLAQEPESPFAQSIESFGVKMSVTETIQSKDGWKSWRGRNLGEEEGIIYATVRKNKYPAIIKWDIKKESSTFHELQRIETVLDYDKGMGHARLIGGKLFVFAALPTEAETRYDLFAIEYDKNTFEILQQQKIGNISPNNDVEHFYSSWDVKEPTKIGLFIDEKSEDGKIRTSFFLINDKLKTLVEKEIIVESEAEVWSLDDLYVDYFSILDNHVAFAIYTKSRYPYDKPKDQFQIDKIVSYLISYEDGTLVKFPLTDLGEERIIRDFEAEFNQNGELLCTGFYYSENQTTALGGAFAQLYNPFNKKLLTQSIYPFDIDFLTMHSTERQKKRIAKKYSKNKNYDLNHYRIEDLIVTSEGTAIMVGQGYRRVPDFSLKSDFFITKIDKEGQIEWVKREERSYSSAVNHKFDLIVVDRDNGYMNILDFEEWPTLYNINKENGEVTRRKFYMKHGTHGGLGLDRQPDLRYLQVSDNKIFVPLLKRSKFNLFKLELLEE